MKFNIIKICNSWNTIISFALIIGIFEITRTHAKGMLYPKDTETREVRSLDGIWNFRLSPSNQYTGFENNWFKNNLKETGHVIMMPVPSSFNDLLQINSIKDFVGYMWYDRQFFIPLNWKNKNKRIWMRLSGVQQASYMWINGDFIDYRLTGHLPLVAVITNSIKFGTENRITVACHNILSKESVPQGIIVKVPNDDGEKVVQDYTFDLYNYAGIHRSVFLYTTPNIFVDDIRVTTSIEGTAGIISYSIYYSLSEYVNVDDVICVVNIKDKFDFLIVGGLGCHNSLTIPDANFWWPHLMQTKTGYLYTMEVSLQTNEQEIIDIYRLKIGIRDISWTNSKLLINNKPIYFRGIDRVEDSDIRGRGSDLVTTVKDLSLIKWMGANAIKTSNYPFSEEFYDIADELGIMIIDECPSIHTNSYSPALLQKHKEAMYNLITRDGNHPSVIMWSIANEPETEKTVAGDYFRDLVLYIKTLDDSRPLTFSAVTPFSNDKAFNYMDIISFNRYYGWLTNNGDLDMIINNVIYETNEWNSKYNKPVLISEYGTGAISGFHSDQANILSEEYQMILMSKHFKAFDELRKTGFFIGEFLSSFADFKTKQYVFGPGNSRKGIFTRDRRPKSSAFHLRQRYHYLAMDIDNVVPPEDLKLYLVNFTRSW